MTGLPLHESNGKTPLTREQLIDQEIKRKVRAYRYRALVSLVLILLGTLLAAVGASMLFGSIWVGVTILGAVTTSVGVLIGRDS